MRPDPTSLSHLHDIIVPPAVSWWPPASGWYAVAVLMALLFTGVLWGVARRRTARRYRVEALAEVSGLRHVARDPRRVAEAATSLAVLLKRAALAAYPRTEVASLSGAAWWRFLDETGATTGFQDEAGPLLECCAYGIERGRIPSPRELDRLFSGAENWLRRHRPAAARIENQK